MAIEITEKAYRALLNDLWEQRKDNRDSEKYDPELEAEFNFRMRITKCEFRGIELEKPDAEKLEVPVDHFVKDDNKAKMETDERHPHAKPKKRPSQQKTKPAVKKTGTVAAKK